MRKAMLMAAMAVVAVPALACEPLGPATTSWATCAAMQLPTTELQAMPTVAHGDPVRRQAWLAAWRPRLAQGCGALAPALKRDAALGRMPVAVADELGVLALVAG